MELEEAKQKLEEFIGLFYEFPNPTSISIRDYEVQAIETVLQSLDNSIPKEKVEKVFETKIYNMIFLADTDWIEHQREVDLMVANLLGIIKEELLEE